MDNGVNLSDAILKFKKTIGAVYCNLISLGAQAGELPQILDDIYKSLKRQEKIRLNFSTNCRLGARYYDTAVNLSAWAGKTINFEIVAVTNYGAEITIIQINNVTLP